MAPAWLGIGAERPCRKLAPGICRRQQFHGRLATPFSRSNPTEAHPCVNSVKRMKTPRLKSTRKIGRFQWPDARAISLAALVISLLMGFTYWVGTLYRGHLMARMGMDQLQFPLGWHEMLTLGGNLLLPKLMFLSSALMTFLLLMLTALVFLAFRFDHWLRHPASPRRHGIMKLFEVSPPEKNGTSLTPPVRKWISARFTPLSIAALVLSSSIAFSGVAAIGILVAIIEADSDADALIRAIRDNDAATLRRFGVNPICIERQTPELVVTSGWQIICSEKFCGVHDGKRLFITPLERVRRIAVLTAEPSLPRTWFRTSACSP